MLCPSCGHTLDFNARFCSNCGARVAATTAAPPPSYIAGTLVRPRYPRMIAGVCAGLAEHYHWDISLVRVLTVLFAVFTGVGALVYLAAWIIIPEAPYTLPHTTGTPTV
ncbi:MAG TPA: PspC domain-containing protein [Granulicella sp.]|jgi:phage shock protein C|nr:PspC domain-containing protein [Granulicella sp.]